MMKMNVEETIDQAKIMLSEGDYTLILFNGQDVFKSSQRGVKTLLKLFEEGKSLEGYCAADKVIGKAAAMLYVLLRIDAIYVHIISKPALDVLKQYQISVSYDQLVDNIINRTQDGLCPMEEATLSISDPKDAPEAIRRKLAQLNSH